MDRKKIPPTPEDVTTYAKSIGFDLDGEAFCDYYEMRGWELSKGVKMKNWQAAVRTWKRKTWHPTGRKSIHEIFAEIDGD